MDQDSESDQLFGWKVLQKLTEKGNLPSVRMGSSFKETLQLGPGTYLVESWSEDFLFGIRTLEMEVDVFSNKKEKIHHGHAEAKSSRLKEKIQFMVKPEHGEVTCKIQLSCGGIKPIEVKCTVFKKVPIEEITEEEESLLFDLEKLSDDDKKKFEQAIRGWSRKDISSVNVNKELVIAQLERESSFKVKAWEAGMIRPFLMLVTLHPEKRLMFASTLDIDLIASVKEYPDPHAESWAMIERNINGIIARTNEAMTESLNPFAVHCTWHQTVQRVAYNVFVVQKGPKNQELKDLRHELKEAKKAPKDSLPICQDRNDHSLGRLEDLFLRAFVEKLRSAGDDEKTKEMKDKYEVFKKSELSQKRVETMLACGFEDPELASFALFQLANAEAAVESETDWAHNSKESKMNALKLGMPIIALAFGPLLVLPAVMLTVNSLRYTFKSTHGRLFVPVLGLILQRACLNANGINLKEYFPKKK